MPRFAKAPLSRKRPAAAPAYQPRHAFTPYIEPPAPMPHRGAVSLTVTGAVAAVVAVLTVVALGSPASGAFAGAAAGRVTSAGRTGVAPAHREVDDVVSSADRSGSNAATVSTAAHPAATRSARTGAKAQSDDDLATDTSSVSSLTSDGIPVTALQAYKNAANTLAVTEPSCGIPWPLLAGIGRVESDHGRFGGAQLLTNGTSTIKILGPVLDGNGTAVIRDTDGGALDGNAQFDRAMGPMQFIPSTWLRYASDGNGDGIDDPFNIFDAALATAKYLCAAGGDLSTVGGQERAVFSYNHLTSYVVEVLSLERAYADGAGVVVPDGLATVTGSGGSDGTVSGTSGGGTQSPGTAKHPNEFPGEAASPPEWPHKSALRPGGGSKAAPPVTKSPVTTLPVTTPPVTTPPVTTPPVTTPPVTTPPVTTPPVTTPPVTTPPVITGPPVAASCPAGTHPIAAGAKSTVGRSTINSGTDSVTTTAGTTTTGTTTTGTTTTGTTTTGTTTTGTTTTGTTTTGTSGAGSTTTGSTTTGSTTGTTAGAPMSTTAGGVPVPAGCVLDAPNAPVSTS